MTDNPVANEILQVRVQRNNSWYIGLLFMLCACLASGQEVAEVTVKFPEIHVTVTQVGKDQKNTYGYISVKNISHKVIGVDTFFVEGIIRGNGLDFITATVDLRDILPIDCVLIKPRGVYVFPFTLHQDIEELDLRMIIESDLASLLAELFAHRIDYQLRFYPGDKYSLNYPSFASYGFRSQGQREYNIEGIPLDRWAKDQIRVTGRRRGINVKHKIFFKTRK